MNTESQGDCFLCSASELSSLGTLLALVTSKHYNNYEHVGVKTKTKTMKLLISACYDNHVNYVRSLLERGENPGANSNEAIQVSSTLGHMELVKMLIHHPRVNPGAERNLAIIGASSAGHVNIVRLLLQDPRVNPGDRNNMAICQAAKNGHVEVVRLLMKDSRVNPGEPGLMAILQAFKGDRVEMLRLFLDDPRVDPCVVDNFPLQWASKLGYVKVVRLLLENKRVWKHVERFKSFPHIRKIARKIVKAKWRRAIMIVICRQRVIKFFDDVRDKLFAPPHGKWYLEAKMNFERNQ